MISTETLRKIPLLSRLDRSELELLAEQLELSTYSPRQRIFGKGEKAKAAYLIVSGNVRVTTVDEDNQEVLIARPGPGTLVGLSSMLDESVRQTHASAEEETRCVELSRHHLNNILDNKPLAAFDMLAALAGELSEAQHLIRGRSARPANVVIEESGSAADRLADSVAHFGGSWSFIITCLVTLILYTALNLWLGTRAWDPYPFILLNLFLSMLAALQAPIIMMSQNRQDQKDRLRSELDFEVNRKAEAELRALSAKVLQLGEGLEDLQGLVRGRSGDASSLD
jgi:CRP/FNR family cyclic AMP-dependent transcriptional regulator